MTDSESSVRLPLPSLKDSCYISTMSHFYRGEMGRIMIWRQRLDVTTTWAITSTIAIITYSYSQPSIPHIVFFFNLAIVWAMLWIEARRYRFYDAFRGRVRMLESHFLVPMISQTDRLLDGEWRRLICEDLILPSFKISQLEAVGTRLKRNYFFIFLLILVAWTLKIFMHADPPVTSLSSFYLALEVGQLPSWFSGIVFFGTLIAMIWLLIFISRKGHGEIQDFKNNRSLWRF